MATMVIGGVFPAQALLSAYLIAALLIPDKHTMLTRANFLSAWWILIAGMEFLAYILQGWTFGYAAEKMVSRHKGSLTADTTATI
jgi:ATP-binding cassette subfamily B (MDR/TAP) protein 1